MTSVADVLVQDTQLIEQAAGGDRRAFRSIVESESDRIHDVRDEAGQGLAESDGPRAKKALRGMVG